MGGDEGVNAIGERGIGKTTEQGVRMVARVRLDFCELGGEGVGEFVAVAWHEDGGGVDAGASAVGGNGLHDHIEELGPACDHVLADEDFRAAGAVDLNGGEGGVFFHRGVAAERNATAAGGEQGVAAFVGGWVVAKGFFRKPGLDHRLHNAERRERILAAGF